MLEFPDVAHGLATTAQLMSLGWTASGLRHLARSSGRIVLPGVYCVHRGPLSPGARLSAAALWAGDDAALTGSFALVAHQVPLGEIPEQAVFIVPKSCRARRCAWARTVRTDRACRTRQLEGLTMVTLERALTDAGLYEEANHESLRAATIAALQKRLTTVSRLRAALAEARRNGTRGVRQGLRDFTDGAWSLPEATLIRLLHRHRPTLPALPNVLLTTVSGEPVGVPDVYLPTCGVAVLVHSAAFHDGLDAAGADRWAATVEADAAYLPHGVVPVGVAPTTLRDDPHRFLRRLDAVVRSQQGRPTPAVLVKDRAEGFVTGRRESAEGSRAWTP